MIAVVRLLPAIGVSYLFARDTVVLGAAVARVIMLFTLPRVRPEFLVGKPRA